MQFLIKSADGALNLWRLAIITPKKTRIELNNTKSSIGISQFSQDQLLIKLYSTNIKFKHPNSRPSGRFLG